MISAENYQDSSGYQEMPEPSESSVRSGPIRSETTPHVSPADLTEFIHEAFDALPAHIAILDGEGRILAVNSAWRRFADSRGWRGANYGVGRKYLETPEISHGENGEERKTLARGIQEVLTDQLEQFHMEYACGTPGNQEYYQVRVNRLRNGGAARTVVAHHEVSEAKRAQEAARTSNLDYRFLFQNNPLPMWVFDEETLSFLAVNDAAIYHYQYSAPEFLAMTLRDIRPPEDLQRLAQQLAREGAEFREAGNWKHRKKDGTVIEVEVYSRPTEWAGRRARIVLIHDITEQKRVEAELRGSEDRYRDLVEHSEDLICTHDLEGRILSVNPAPARILGYRPEELVNRRIRDFLPPQKQPEFEKYLETMLRDGVAKGLVAAVTRSGEKRVWEYHNTLRTKGVVTPIVRGIAHDITERWRAEKALRASEEQFSKVFHSSPDPICITTLDQGKVLHANDSFSEITGYAREEVIGKAISSLRLWHSPDERAKVFAEFNKRGRVRNMEVKLRTKSGEERIWLLSFEAISVGGQSCILSASKDVTNDKRAEAALRGSEEKFRQLAEHMTDIFWLYDLDAAQGIYVNPAFEKILGYPSEDLYRNPRRWFQSIHPEDRVAVDGEYARASRTGNINHVYRIVLPDGSIRSLRERGFGVRDEKGVIRRFVGIAEDITDKVQLEDLLRQAQKMEAVGQLAGGFAHDFSNLLTIIKGYCEQLKRQPLGSETIRSAVDEIHLAANRGSELTRQLLAFSRKQKLEPQVLDFNVLVADVKTILRRTLGEDVRLVFVLQHGLRPVKVDRVQFEEVLLNLAVNARDAMPQGGRLTITTSNADPDKAFFRSHPGLPPGPCIVLSVRDTGVGMDARTREHIFEPFFTTKAAGKGTGLGLATVYGVVQQSGGSIEVNSKPGEGTTFRIYLPATQEPAEIAPAGAPEPFPYPGHETILLVEDDHRVRQLLRDFLEQCGYSVKAAPDGIEALRIACDSQTQIDLLLTDLVMPGMGGSKLAREVARERPGIRLLFISGHSEQSGIQNHALVSGEAFLEKPFSLDALGRRLREILDNHRRD